MIEPIRWVEEEGGYLRLLDQTQLPARTVFLACHRVEEIWAAIRNLSVRGAPLIGLAAAYGAYLGIRESTRTRLDFDVRAGEVLAHLATARPTAVNLFWALGGIRDLLDGCPELPPTEAARAVLDFARTLHAQDAAMCQAMARHGAELIQEGETILTHCNTGYLATGGMGTALGVIFEAHRQGKRVRVIACEARPLLQGARLTAWECGQMGVPVTLICDGAAAAVLGERRVARVLVGADRIAANGDVANKIGTYGLSLLARAHDIPFYVAAPVSTIDFESASGARIPIEERDPDEVRTVLGSLAIAPGNTPVYNPAFDVTPHRLIDGIITNHGVVRAPFSETLLAGCPAGATASRRPGGVRSRA